VLLKPAQSSINFNKKSPFRAICLLSRVGKLSPPVNPELSNRTSDIDEAPIGPRSRVATSPDKLRECQWELEADTERFIETIEVRP
jgi:hypothetical protein